MRRILVGIIIFTLLVPIFTINGFADSKSSIYKKDEIENLVREKLDLNEKLSLEYSNLLTYDLKQKQFWNLEFNSQDTNISVTVDAESGEITSIYKWIKADEDRTVKILSNTAKKNGINFIKSLEPDKYKETEEVTSESPSIIIYDLQRDYEDSNDYHFTFVRKVGGEYFPNNYFRLRVSGITGEITQYQMEWDEVTFDNRKNIISKDRARNSFEKEDQLQLKYMALDSHNKDKKSIILTPVYVYNPKDTNMINALDGRFLDYDEIYYQGYNYLSREESKNMAGMDMESSADGGSQLIPEEGILSKEKIEKIVIDSLARELNVKDLIVEDSSYFNNLFNNLFNKKGKYWRLAWRDKEKNKRLNTVVNAEDGSLLSLDFYNNSEDIQPIEDVILNASDSKKISNVDDLDEDKIKKQILNKIQNIFPFIEDENINFQLINGPKDGEKKSIVKLSSSRYINKIPYDDNYLRIDYDYNTEEITRLSYKWNEVEIKSTSKIVDKKTIEKKFYDTVGFEKYLIQITDQDAKKTKGLDIALKELLPIYTLKSFGFAYIDAESSEFLDRNGEKYEEGREFEKVFKDLNGYKYEEEINLMNKMGVLKEKRNYFYPSNSLLKKDAIKWIVEIGWRRGVYSLDGNYEYYLSPDMPNMDMDRDDPYYPYIIAAIKNGIIDEKIDPLKLNEKAEKLEITKWIIKAMKQEELANFIEIFKNPYEDMEEILDEDIGYLALAKYYGLYRDMEFDGVFQTDKNLTRGEFIKVLYNLMKNR